jgi:hypothetical protein
MKRTVLSPLDLTEARRRLVAMRSSHSENRQITTMINRLMGRLAHLNEPKNQKHEEYLRKIITEMMERAGQIASQVRARQTTWTPQDDARLRRMVEAELPADEIATHLGRPVSSPKKRGHVIGLPLKWFKSGSLKGGHRTPHQPGSTGMAGAVLKSENE